MSEPWIKYEVAPLGPLLAVIAGEFLSPSKVTRCV